MVKLLQTKQFSAYTSHEISALLVVFFATNKDTHEFAGTLRKMKSKPTNLWVNRLPCYVNGVDTCGYTPVGYKHLLVVNIDSTECTSCGISHLFEWKDWFEIMENKDMSFSVIFIFQPKNDEILDIRNRLRRNSQIYKDIPLYLDVDGSFLKSNFDFRIPPIMQTMLLNDTGSIAYVGNPLINKTIKEDILNIIKNKQNEKN